MKKILGGLSVILLIGITLRLITGQQLRADDEVAQTTDSSITSMESQPSGEPAGVPEEQEPDSMEEIPVIPENETSTPVEESISEESNSSEVSSDSSSEESVESSTSSSSDSSTTTTSSTSSSSSTSTSSSSSNTSSSSSTTASTTASSSSTTPSSTGTTTTTTRTGNTEPTYSNSIEPTIPKRKTTVVSPNPTGSIYSGLNDFSNTATLGLDQSYKTDFADSELKGFELPLLNSFEDKRHAALIYEAIKQLSIEQEEPLTNEGFVSGIYQRVLQQDLTTLTEQDLAEDQLVAGDVLYLEKEEQKICAGIYLGDGYLLSVKEPSEENKEVEDTHQSSETEKKEVKKTEKQKKRTKRPSNNQGSTPTDDSVEKEDTTKKSDDREIEGEKSKESQENDPLVVQQTSDRDAKGKWLVLRETTNELTTYGQELLKDYPASMDFKASAQTQKFVETIGEDAQKLGQEYDVFASVMIAQAILESGSGTSGLSVAPYYNLFGIKGSYKGNAVNMSTQEDGGSGNMYTIQSAFRAYPNYAASLGDYVELIRGGISGSENYYSDVWRSNAKNYLRASEKLTGKYATDTSYHRKLASLISVYHLTQYDKQQVQAETPLNGSGTETGIFIKGKNEIPAEYAKLMKYKDYNGVNYNKSGSYPVGQCTWYAFNRVAQLGKQVDDFMGNGGEWATKGRALGYEVSSTPKAGRLISFTPGVAGSDPRYGHVAFVEAVGPNGILISEGNVYGGTVISYRVISNDLALSNLVSYVTPK